MLRMFLLLATLLIIHCKSNKLLKMELPLSTLAEQTPLTTSTKATPESSKPPATRITQSQSNKNVANAEVPRVLNNNSSSFSSTTTTTTTPSTTTSTTLPNARNPSAASHSSTEPTTTTVRWETEKDPAALPYFLRDYVMKRAVPVGTYKNGLIPGSMIPSLSSQKGIKHPYAVQAFDRPLYHGDTSSKWEYVGLWWSNGERAVWGKLVMNDHGGVDGYFVLNNVVRNTSEASVFAASRYLIYEGSKDENNFSFVWVQARLVDPTTVVSVTNGCPQYAPAIYTDTHENYEFLGEADVVNKRFHYVRGGKHHQLTTRDYLRDVYVLTKQRCSCSCDQTIIGSSFR